MKAFFVPGYLYNSLPDFEKVIENLRKQEKHVEIDLVFMQADNSNWRVSGYDECYFEKKNFTLLKMPLLERYENIDAAKKAHSLTLKAKKIFRKLVNFQRLLVNFYEIGSFLRTENPDVVILTSDLGPGKYYRFLCEHCMLQNVPILILYTFDLTEKPVPALTIRLKNFLFHFRFGIIRFIRAILPEYLPDSQAVGSYAPSATICVNSAVVRSKLLASGIENDRIVLVKSPVMITDEAIKSKIRKKLDIPISSKVVILFSERIEQFYYGQEYIKELYEGIANIFTSLSVDIDVFFIIKPHPYESAETTQLIENVFTGERCRIISDINAEELIAASDISIAHFSKVLITASLMDKMFLSINLKNDRSYTFIPQNESYVLEMRSFKEINNKIRNALTSESAANEIKSSCRRIAKSFNPSDKDFVDVVLETLKL